ncbi:MAG: twin-arginine translocase TatA/TatE family subunit [Acidimicrobiales bacterium]
MPLSPPADLFGEQGIIVLVVVALVLFGSTQIPKLARSLGSAQKEFKKGLEEGGSEEGKSEATPAESTAAPASPPAQAQGPADGSNSAST